MSWGFNVQSLIVVPLVALALAYSAWALMPGSLRRALALGMARVHWLGRVPAIRRAAQAPSGCGCDGCDRSASAAQAAIQDGAHVVRIVRQRPSA